MPSAELILRREVVLFEWSISGLGLVNVKWFDYEINTTQYSEGYENITQARETWNKLVELGYKRGENWLNPFQKIT